MRTTKKAESNVCVLETDDTVQDPHPRHVVSCRASGRHFYGVIGHKSLPSLKWPRSPLGIHNRNRHTSGAPGAPE